MPERNRISHIGIAAIDGCQMASFFTAHLGGEVTSKTEYPELKQVSTMVRIGECDLEIMEPTSEDGVVGKFILKRGPGLHHISIQVNNILEMASKLETSGVQLIGKSFDDPHIRYMFISPKSTGGVLIELFERQ